MQRLQHDFILTTYLVASATPKLETFAVTTVNWAPFECDLGEERTTSANVALSLIIR